MKVLVVGAWHLGSSIACCIADRGHDVEIWDQTDRTANSWKNGKVPVFEPGLEEIVSRTWGRGLRWAEAPRAEDRDWVIIAYDTPINDRDEVILDSVLEGFETLLQSGVARDARFLVTCQVPVGTSRRMLNRLRETHPDWNGTFMYQPENLRLGNAITSFVKPDRAVVGFATDDADTRMKCLSEYRDLVRNPDLRIDAMGLESAEMVKHAMNSFLATCVVFGNEVANLCEKSGANAWEVFASLKQDSRVGPRAFLSPGLGFAGGTLARDLRVLSGLSAESENLFSAIYSINESRNDWVRSVLQDKLEGSLRGKRVVLLGVTYKPQTSTVRRSPAVEIAKLLAEAGAECVALDPMADLSELSEAERGALPFQLLRDAKEAFQGAAAAVLVTEWPQFKELDVKSLVSLMTSPLVIDTKNFLKDWERVEGVCRVVPGTT